jgi:hypothetical protein
MGGVRLVAQKGKARVRLMVCGGSRVAALRLRGAADSILSGKGGSFMQPGCWPIPPMNLPVAILIPASIPARGGLRLRLRRLGVLGGIGSPQGYFQQQTRIILRSLIGADRGKGGDIDGEEKRGMPHGVGGAPLRESRSVAGLFCARPLRGGFSGVLLQSLGLDIKAL